MVQTLKADNDNVVSWRLRVASWNVLNFGDRKSGLNPVANKALLLARMAQVAGQYEIVIFQEVLNGGNSVTQALAALLPAYNCNNFTVPSGRRGRQERYVMCYLSGNADGVLVLNNFFDYMGNQYTAIDGSAQTAQNIWMRPPARMTFTFTPNEVQFGPFTFDVYTNHTKPSYGAGARPPGTPAASPASQSVRNELTSIETNQIAPASLIMLIGDLNVDCASYPVRDRDTNFPLPTWHWYIGYGERTNTAPLSSCAYDRIILNQILNPYYQDHGIVYDHYNNATRLNGSRISDHYLVWVELGAQQAKKRQRTITATKNSVSVGTRKRAFTRSMAMKLIAQGIKPGIQGNVFIIRNNSAFNFASYQPFNLVDVRGQPNSVTISNTGEFTVDPVWNSLESGAYNFVFDINRDGIYNRADGDFSTYPTQADVIVLESDIGHNNLVTLGDNFATRSLYDLGQAINIYALAKSLPKNTTANYYIISNKLFKSAGYSSWQQARSAKMSLLDNAVPIAYKGGSILISSLKSNDKYLSFTTDNDGYWFQSIWTSLSQLLNTAVFTQIPSPPDYKPEYAGDGLPTEGNVSDDPCAFAYQSDDTNFQAVCNIGHTFTDYYGDAFNIILDLNNNGLFDNGDVLGVRDIGDMTTFFNAPGNTTLNSNADGNPAVSEYKEYLNGALSLNTPLNENNSYDVDTEKASSKYICSSTLSKAQFNAFVIPDSQTGFRVVESDTYQLEHNKDTGVFAYENLYWGDTTVKNGQDVCVSTNTLIVDDLSAEKNSSITVVADSHVINGQINSTTDAEVCFNTALKVEGTVLSIGAGGGVISGGGTFLAALFVDGVIAIGSNLYCGSKLKSNNAQPQ